MNKKNRQVLQAIFTSPTPSNIRWTDIVSLFNNLGALITEGNGSRVRIELHESEAVFHRPHPQKEASRALVKGVKRYLESAGITHDDI